MNEGDEVYITKSKLKPYFDSKNWPGAFDANAADNAYKVFNPLFEKLDLEEENEEPVG